MSQDQVSNVIYGRNPVTEVISRKPSSLLVIYLTPSAKKWLEKTPYFSILLENGVKICEVDKFEVERLAPQAVHQGVVAELTSRKLFSLDELSRLSNDECGRGVIVALDELQDPRNLGAVLRAAECSGADGVIVPNRRSVQITPSVVKASAGASEVIPIAFVGNLVDSLLKLKKQGFWVLGTEVGSRAEDLYEVDIPSPVVLVFGSEGKGIRPLVQKNCDLLVKIPLEGGIESLNVSQAASVVLFEILRRRRS